MAETVRNKRGQTFQLSKIIGRGGEASVHRVAGKPAILAKIYTRPNPDREGKLAWMIANPPDDPTVGIGHTSISWPLDLVYREGRFSGYLMPHIRDAVPVLNVLHPRLRRHTFHQFTARHLHNTAYNIAAALGAIHERSYVVGDLNESNVLVSRSTLVTLIDTDSFQVQVPGLFGSLRTHFCEVGKPEYLPPELQKAELEKTVRTPENDRFALAVLVFQLLMDGSHPFRARWVGTGEKPTLPERIERGMFPYRQGVGRYVEPAVGIEMLHPLLVDLFKRCFILGHDSPPVRPQTGEWERVLSEVAGSLIACRNGHFRSPHLDRCQECGREPPPRNRPVRLERPAANPVPNPATIAAPPPTAPPPTAPAPSPAPGSTGYGGFPIISLAVLRPLFGSRAAALGRRLGHWARSNAARNHVLQPALWAMIGFTAGGLVGTQVAVQTVGQTFGLVGGLTTGALAGDVVEKKIGWEIFLGVFGTVAGLLAWYLVWNNGGLTGWILSAAAGGIAGSLLGRYGRSARLTLLWAASGALGGWLLGSGLAGSISPGWLGGALSAGTVSLITGAAYSLWKRFG
ncbi:MAG TPA: hypothetical protein VMN57_14875 [Anaerolineales bacterium]|nr:hypothetical protein [Anaerolineales bacterium]